jgi:hypothetical protein
MSDRGKRRSRLSDTADEAVVTTPSNTTYNTIDTGKAKYLAVG